VPVSTAMKLCTYRMSEAEKKRLQELARERNITLSYAIREGMRLYLEEWSVRDRSDAGERVATP
jgi:predicted transcriptional regulator